MAHATPAAVLAEPAVSNSQVNRALSHIAGQPAMITSLRQESGELIAGFSALVDALATHSDDAGERLKAMRRHLVRHAGHVKAAEQCLRAVVRPLVHGEADELTKVWLAYLSPDARSADGNKLHEGLRHVW